MFDSRIPRPESRLALHAAHDHGVEVVSLYGELDLASAETLDRELRRIVAAGARQVVVDLSGLAFLDASGLRALLGAQARSRANGHRVSFLRGRPEVQRVFELTGTDEFLRFDD